MLFQICTDEPLEKLRQTITLPQLLHAHAAVKSRLEAVDIKMVVNDDKDELQNLYHNSNGDMKFHNYFQPINPERAAPVMVAITDCNRELAKIGMRFKIELLPANWSQAVQTKALEKVEEKKEMKQQMQVFKYNDVQVRSELVNGEPWFCAKDVCGVLDLKNSRDALGRLRDKDKGVVLTDTLGGKQKMTYVSEQGAYDLILRSDKPGALEIRYWLTDEVLPALRKTGEYVQPTHHVQQEKAKPKKITVDKRLEIMELKARTQAAVAIRLLIAEHPGLDSVSKAAIVDNAVNMITGDRAIEAPQTERHYTATELAKEFCVTAMKIGQVANAKGLKTDSNGMLVLDKSPYSSKQVESFRYNENGRLALQSALAR